MRFGSLFSGVGGFDLGLERAGHECAWQVEYDKQARAVLRRHWPNVDLYEDVRDVGSTTLAPVDLICGGFPCQDLSVAGRRAGLDGERSGLWFEFHRIVSELVPRWVLVENVPGLLSSNGGADLAVILRGLAELGYVGAWRVVDSQHFGVAQRRKRVFLLACRDPGGASPAEILAIPEGLSGHPAPGREAGAGVANALTGGSGKKGGPDDNAAQGGHVVATHDVAPTLQERGGKGVDSDCTAALAFQCHGSNIGPMGTLRRGNGSTQSGVPFVVDEQNAAAVEMVGALGTGLAHGNRWFAVAQAFKSSHYTRGKDGAPSEVAPPISADADRGDQDTLVFNWQSGGDCRGLSPQEKSNALHVGQVPAVFRKAQKAHDADDCERWEHAEHAGTLAVHSTTSSEVALACIQEAQTGTRLYENAGTLRADAPGAQPCGSLIMAAVPRKLTPTECERLQAFPDGWTEWGVDDEGNRVEMADGPRYRMMGNAVTVNVAEWIGTRLKAAETEQREQAT